MDAIESFVKRDQSRREEKDKSNSACEHTTEEIEKEPQIIIKLVENNEGTRKEK